MDPIVTLTMNPSIDTSSAVENVVAEHKLRCGPASHEPGGGGINVARAIGKLGGSARAIYVSGGPYGDLLDTLLAGEGIEHTAIDIAGATRQNIAIYENSSQLQFRFNMEGPTLTPTECQACLDAIRQSQPQPRHIIASGSLPAGVPEDFYAQLARTAHEMAASLVIDTSGPALKAALEVGVTLIKPNMRELEGLIGREIGSQQEMQKAVMEIIDSGGSKYVVVSLGAGGALAASAEKGCQLLPTPTVPIRSKVGAGDSMLAGMAYAAAQGREFDQVIRFGLATGAAAVMTPGSELCRREDTERLFQWMLENT